MSRRSNQRATGGVFRFRVSDSLDVPRRGHLLRLKLLEGSPSLDDLSPGRPVRLRPPGENGGAGRVVEVIGFSETGGRPTRERLETKRELDIVVPREAAVEVEPPVRVGWFVEGPVSPPG